MKLPRVTLSAEKIAALKSADIHGDVQTGERIFKGLGDTARAAGGVANTIANVGGKVLDGGGRVAGGLLRAGGNAAQSVLGSNAGRYAVGGALLGAPILANAYHNNVQQDEGELMQIRRNPERVITAADLDGFLQKHANTGTQAGGGGKGFAPDMKGEFMKGFGNAAGKSIVETVAGSIMNGASSLFDYLNNDSARKQLLQNVMKNDQVLSDAIKADPKAAQHIIEAYQTMVRFAPALSLDPNVVKSFLRQAATSGGGVDYHSVKMLADTQKSVASQFGH